MIIVRNAAVSWLIKRDARYVLIAIIHVVYVKCECGSARVCEGLEFRINHEFVEGILSSSENKFYSLTFLIFVKCKS